MFFQQKYLICESMNMQMSVISTTYIILHGDAQTFKWTNNKQNTVGGGFILCSNSTSHTHSKCMDDKDGVIITLHSDTCNAEKNRTLVDFLAIIRVHYITFIWQMHLSSATYNMCIQTK